RLHRGRPALPAVRGGLQPQAGLAGAGRQVAQHHPAGRPRPRRRRRHRRLGIFFNAGEMCTAPSRLLVHRSVAGRVLDRIVARAESLRVGDPLDPATEMGPLVSAAQRDRVLSYVEAGTAEGARLVAGGTPIDGDGHYMRPTVFDGVRPAMRIAREEIFGPVLSVLEFDDVEEAVRLANDTDYGLAAAVWTSDLSAAHRVSRALRAGTVWVNCYEEGDMSVPFGGF